MGYAIPRPHGVNADLAQDWDRTQEAVRNYRARTGVTGRINGPEIPAIVAEQHAAEASGDCITNFRL